jgi:hypothetical protein
MLGNLAEQRIFKASRENLGLGCGVYFAFPLCWDSAVFLLSDFVLDEYLDIVGLSVLINN